MSKNKLFYYTYYFSHLALFFGCKSSNTSELIKEFDTSIPANKIWAHRVNSLKNVKDKLLKFKGIEIDIFYSPNKNSFTVKHDIEANGIDLEYI